jgi:hypothetical protein
MIRPSSFAIHVTYTCPLACAHCCFSSSPSNRDRLPVDHILGAIDGLNAAEVGLVAFTGGEPFLLGKDLVNAIARAKGRGFKTRVVTSAYFGKHEETARKRLEEVRSAGLDEMTISWDDFHEAFVAFDAVATVFRLARELGIRVGINVVQARDSFWTAARVRERLGLPEDSPECIGETPLNHTGRAETDLTEAGLRPKRYLGPCPYVLTGPTLSAKNKLLACCGVIPHTDALTLDPDFRPENLNAAIEKGLRSPLLNWLYLRGPYAIMEYVSARFGVAIPAKESIGGNCEACKLLFETPEVVRHLDEAVALKAAEIEGELGMLAALGWLSPEKLQHLWQDSSLVLDRPPA